MWDSFWTNRGQPWEFDPGPPVGGHLNELFAENTELPRHRRGVER